MCVQATLSSEISAEGTAFCDEQVEDIEHNLGPESMGREVMSFNYKVFQGFEL